MKATNFFESVGIVTKGMAQPLVENIVVESESRKKVVKLLDIYFSPLTKEKFLETFAGWIQSKNDSQLYDSENHSIVFDEGSKKNIRYETNRKTSTGITLPFVPKNIEQIITDCENVGIPLYFSEEIKKLLYSK